MRLKVPPVFVFLIFGGFMYLLARFLPVGYFDFFGRTYLIFFLIGIAGSIGCISLFQFFRSKTTIDPTTPSKASKLVTLFEKEYKQYCTLVRRWF